MQIHASCVGRDGAGVLLLGPSGCGKSDLVLRLLECGFVLVADDRVDIEDGLARAPAAIAGLLEIRGLGIVRLPYAEHVTLALAVQLSAEGDRLPASKTHLGLPLVTIDPKSASASARVALALDCALGHVTQVSGAFAS